MVVGMVLDGVDQVCIAAGRGMTSQDTLAGLEQRNGLYMLGARLRSGADVGNVMIPHHFLEITVKDGPRIWL
jgi:hypothetical protein